MADRGNSRLPRLRPRLNVLGWLAGLWGGTEAEFELGDSVLELAEEDSGIPKLALDRNQFSSESVPLFT